MNCAFCDIIAGNATTHIVFEDEACLAFLDKRPLFPGHCLLVPKKHIGNLPELDSALIKPLFSITRLLSGAVETAMKAEGTFVAINNKVSQSVPHLHIHVVPRKKKDGLKGFFWPRNPYRDEEHMLEVCERIKKVISDLT